LLHGLCRIVLGALLLLAPIARAEEDRVLGLQLAAGAPTGAEATVLIRPLSFLRFEGGVTTDLVAPGVHGGLTLAVPWYISPVLSAEVGYQFAGDVNRLLAFAGVSGSNPLLSKVAYAYGSLHGGIELGFPNHFMLVIHAGYSVIRAETNGLDAYLASQQSNLGVTASREGKLQLITPSAKVGLLFWIF
jgi:hypothetical protein